MLDVLEYTAFTFRMCISQINVASLQKQAVDGCEFLRDLSLVMLIN